MCTDAGPYYCTEGQFKGPRKAVWGYEIAPSRFKTITHLSKTLSGLRLGCNMFILAKESALKVDSRRKIPCRSGDSNLCQYILRLVFRSHALTTELPRPLQMMSAAVCSFIGSTSSISSISGSSSSYSNIRVL